MLRLVREALEALTGREKPAKEVPDDPLYLTLYAFQEFFELLADPKRADVARNRLRTALDRGYDLASHLVRDGMDYMTDPFFYAAINWLWPEDRPSR
jgi:hypothetical protein